jgi:hypothetical protein
MFCWFGPDMTASPSTPSGFQTACASIPVIELGGNFSKHDAGKAGAELLHEIEVRLKPGTA